MALACIGVAVVAVAVAALAQTAAGRSAGGTAAAQRVIAVSFPGATQQAAVEREFFYAKAKAKKDGFKIIFDDPGTDLNKQMATLRTWIQQKVTAIVCVPLNPAVFESIAKQARSAGIKWVTYAQKLHNQDATLGFPDRHQGFLLGQAAGKWVKAKLGGKANVALLTFQQGLWARQRRAGIEAGLKSVAPQAKIVAAQDALSNTQGQQVTSTLLQAHPDLNAVLAVEETASEGAYQAFLNGGHKATDPKVFIGGLDGTSTALKLLKQGKTMYRASVALDLQAVGQGMVALPERLLAGKKGDFIVPVALLTPGSPLIGKYLREQG